MSTSGRQTRVLPDHFAKLAGHWSHFGAPLRPSPFDTSVIREIASGLPAAPRVVVLGLTPETITCSWPADTHLLALDHSSAMAASMWPQPGAPARSGMALADWLQMPVADASAHVVCADGCHTQLSYPQGYAVLSAEVCRVLKPGGRFVARVFVRPDQPEPLQAIAAALAEGAIGSVHALKLRLLAALHGQSGTGTRLDDVWRAWKRMPTVPRRLADLRGWSVDEIASMDAYGGMATRYYLPTLAELRAIHAAHFVEQACHSGDYELARRCPTLVLERRG